MVRERKWKGERKIEEDREKIEKKRGKNEKGSLNIHMSNKFFPNNLLIHFLIVPIVLTDLECH